jgi:hypothetical protein
VRGVALRSGVEVPEHVAFQMLVEREAEDRRRGHWLEAELRQLDDRFRVRFFNSDHGVPWIKPGRWHVIRLNPDGAPPTAMPIERDGEYCEPHSGVLEELRRRDSWRLKGSLADHMRAHQAKEAEQARREAEDRREEMKQDFETLAKINLSPQPTFGRHKPGKERKEVEELNSKMMRRR